ncbi:hypothetical protein LJC69_06385, partial [Bacteroidales bacterium OttesenSCG-928-K22]|nr:hypothetical protein [Bacteroidales bacterium OttesenSCG-928-K22]
TQEEWNFIAEKYVDCKGIIFDVRNNGGGYVANVNFIGSQLVDFEFLYGVYKVKNGPKHNDFSEYIPLMVYPVEKQGAELQTPQAKRFKSNNIIVLTNRHCYSATNFFVMLMKSLPNVTVVGDYTGGGGGLPMDYQLPNGWNYRFSSTISYDNREVNIEHGIAPHIKIDMSPEDIAEGKDSLIEKAISILNKNSK